MGNIITTDGQSTATLGGDGSSVITFGATDKFVFDASTTGQTQTDGVIDLNLSTGTNSVTGVYVNTSLSADNVDAVASYYGTVAGYSSGHTNGTLLSVYEGFVTGDNNDTDVSYVVFNAANSTATGGSSEIIALVVGTGYDWTILSESGDLGFTEYTPTLSRSDDANTAASTESPLMYYGDAGTRTWDTGALANQRENYFKAPTLAFAGASVVTEATTLYIDNAPQEGANATITDSYALQVAAGDCAFGGLILADGGLAVKSSGNNVTDPPTDAELDTAFGDASSLDDGYVGILDDNNAATDCYICWVMNSAWFYIKGTKAV